MGKKDYARLLWLTIVIIWSVAALAVVHTIVMESVSSDQQSTSLRGDIEGQSNCPMSTPTYIQTDLDIRFSSIV